MWPFKTKIVTCGRHKLIEALDEATTRENVEKQKLSALRSERRGLVEELIAFAEPQYFKRYRIKKEEVYEQLINRDKNDWELVSHWEHYKHCIDPRDLYRFPISVFDGYEPIVHYLDREDFEDYPDTYELVRLLLTVIHSCDNAIKKQEQLWKEAGIARRAAVDKIEAAAVPK